MMHPPMDTIPEMTLGLVPQQFLERAEAFWLPFSFLDVDRFDDRPQSDLFRLRVYNHIHYRNSYYNVNHIDCMDNDNMILEQSVLELLSVSF